MARFLAGALAVAAVRGFQAPFPLASAPRLLARLAAASPATAATSTSTPAAADWRSVVAGGFLITTSGPSGEARRGTAREYLRSVGLEDALVEQREFATDDADRVRGCYTSHIAVLEEAVRLHGADPAARVLVVEDNIEVSPRYRAPTVDDVRRFCDDAAHDWSLMHLAYIMYVPGLTVLPAGGSSDGSVVRLDCTPGSVLGTTAYVIRMDAAERLLAVHRERGYGQAIPDLMAELFPQSRYAAYPMPFHRGAKVKSLVNPQLDDLRALLFVPAVFTLWERLMVKTNLSTNVLFPALCVALLLGALAGAGSGVAALADAAAGKDVGNPLGPLLGSGLSLACLLVLYQGVSLAPKPPEPEKEK